MVLKGFWIEFKWFYEVWLYILSLFLCREPTFEGREKDQMGCRFQIQGVRGLNFELLTVNLQEVLE